MRVPRQINELIGQDFQSSNQSFFCSKITKTTHKTKLPLNFEQSKQFMWNF